MTTTLRPSRSSDLPERTETVSSPTSSLRQLTDAQAVGTVLS